MDHQDCGVSESYCLCVLPSGHETPHVCCCGGSYRRDGDTLYIYALPPAIPYHEEFDTTEEAIVYANERAREGYRLVDEGSVNEPWPFNTPRKLIKFFQTPTID